MVVDLQKLTFPTFIFEYRTFNYYYILIEKILSKFLLIFQKSTRLRMLQNQLKKGEKNVRKRVKFTLRTFTYFYTLLRTIYLSKEQHQQ